MESKLKLTLMALVLLTLASPSRAEPPNWHGDRHHNWQGQHGPRVDPNAAIVGGMIGGWLWRQFNQPPVVIQEAPQALAPWTPEWYQFCTGRFRSFNPQTGYYMGFDGVPHFCR